MKKLIQIKNLSKKYGDTNALNQLGLAIPRNEIFGLLGPNGAGKSTLIKIILGLVKLTQGSILFNEKNLFHHRTEFVNQIGCLMETPAFHTHLTGRENLNYLNNLSGKIIARTALDSILEKAGILDRADTLVRTYSQGMRQRLGLANALMSNPDFIILDEPTNGLDPNGINEMRQLIQSLYDDGKTIFLSSHLLGEVEKVCTKVAIINQGQIVKEGRIEELLKEDQKLSTLEEYFLHHTVENEN